MRIISPERCIRVLIHWNTTRKSEEIIHVYLKFDPDGLKKE
jgi:chorismate mutase